MRPFSREETEGRNLNLVAIPLSTQDGEAGESLSYRPAWAT